MAPATIEWMTSKASNLKHTTRVLKDLGELGEKPVQKPFFQLVILVLSLTSLR
jgi:hypothetical protein